MNLKSYLSVGMASLAVLASAGVAKAATIIPSELKISGTLDATALGIIDENGFPTTTFEFDNIGGNPNPGTGEFLINEGNGPLFQVFNPTPFQGGTIRDLPVDGSFAPVENFLDFSFDANSGVPTLNQADFDLEEIVGISQTSTDLGVTTSFSVRGNFDFPGQQNVVGIGTFSADITFDAIPGVDNFEQYQAFLSEEGNMIEGIAYSADFIVEQVEENGVVPESSNIVALLGFGLLGGALVAKKTKKVKV